MAFLERNANSGSVSTGYDIDNSLKLNSANSEYLYIHRDASGSDWNRLLWTASMWVKHIPTESSATAPKERLFGAADAQSDFDIRFRGWPLGFRNNSDVDGVGELRTNAVYRDYSAWMHIVAVWDTANGTAGNRMRLYVNGEEVTSFVTDTQPSQNEKSIWGKKNDGTDGNVAHTIGAYYNSSSGFAQGLNGYLAEVHWVEGAALAPTEFGEFDSASGIWKPKEADVTYGTNGFYLKFDDSSALGADSSGNSNSWSLNNIAAADQSTDTPTNNFVTFNPLNPTYGTSVISEGGTKLKGSGQNTFDNIQTTIGVTKGKWYCELEPQADSAAQNTAWGVVNLDTAVYAGDHYGVAGFWSAGFDDGRLAWHYYNGGGAGTETVNYGTGSGDTAGTIAMALDLDNGTLKFYIRNTQLSISASSIPAGTYAFFGDVMGTAAPYLNFNFGGYTVNSISSAESDANGYGTFEYAPPSGYYALCTKNLAEYG